MNIMILGGNGYLGWSLGVHLAQKNEHNIVFIDNFSKRHWVNESSYCSYFSPRQYYCDIEPLVHNTLINNKVKQLNKCEFVAIDVTNKSYFLDVLTKYKPDVIFCFAHQASAPFSMINLNNGLLTLQNNEAVTLTTLSCVAEICPDALIIFSGSAGVYENTDSSFIPMDKCDFKGNHKGTSFKISNSWLPMGAMDFYHQSKVHTFGLVDMCVKLWSLRVITVQQSTIYGVSPGCDIPENLYPDFYYDSIWGTVINRFMTQTVLGVPMTVYGDGSNSTGLISLEDSVKVYEKLMMMNVDSGDHVVKHNLTSKMKIVTIAQLIQEMFGGRIQYLDHPRMQQKQDNEKVFEMNDMNTQNKRSHLTTMYDYIHKHKSKIISDHILPDIKWRHNDSKK